MDQLHTVVSFIGRPTDERLTDKRRHDAVRNGRSQQQACVDAWTEYWHSG